MDDLVALRFDLLLLVLFPRFGHKPLSLTVPVTQKENRKKKKERKKKGTLNYRKEMSEVYIIRDWESELKFSPSHQFFVLI